MHAYEDDTPISIGTGVTTSIRELAEVVREIAGFEDDLVFDIGRPDGAAVKNLDSTPLRALGWARSWDLRDALESTHGWFVARKGGQSQ